MKESVYSVLSEVKTKDYVEAKGGKQEYLSWSNSWRMLKEKFPTATRTVYENEATGLNYHSDGRTAYVKVGVTVDGLEHIDYLPIMNFRNNSIPLPEITSMDVNKTIQRSTTKAIAMHGLGLNLWTGEEETEEVKSVVKVKKDKLTKSHEAWNKMMAFVDENKALGAEAIIRKIEMRYEVSASLKAIISKRVES